MARTFDAATAQDLIERGLESVGGKRLVVKAKPVIKAALEAVRQSAHVSGKRGLPITGVSVSSGDDVVFQVTNEADKGPVNTKKDRTPIAYGGSHYTCWLIAAGTPPTYFCVYF